MRDAASVPKRQEYGPGAPRCPDVCLLVNFAIVCTQLPTKDRPSKGKGGLRRCADKHGKSPLVCGKSGAGHLGDYLGRAKAASARTTRPASLSW